MQNKLSLLSVLFVVSIMLIACNIDRFYEVNVAIGEDGWEKESKVKFEVNVKDTLALYDFYINLRNTGAYPYSNVFLYVHSMFPDGSKAKDTVECFLADPSGKWLGRGSGDIWDNQILFKKGVSFPRSGVYVFEYEQAMRINPLPAIIDAGLRIERQD